MKICQFDAQIENATTKTMQKCDAYNSSSKENKNEKKSDLLTDVMKYNKCHIFCVTFTIINIINPYWSALCCWKI